MNTNATISIEINFDTAVIQESFKKWTNSLYTASDQVHYN